MNDAPVLDTTTDRWLELDRRLVAAARGVKVLTHLAWPEGLRERFLAAWEAGRPELPEIPHRTIDLAQQVEELRAIVRACSDPDPLPAYIARTAQSYVTAARALGATGTPAFTQASIELYGAPGDAIAPGAMSNLEAADHFIRYSDSFKATASKSEADYSVLPETLRLHLERVCEEAFPGHTVQVVVDPGLSSKAAAGASRVRVRGDTRFAEVDLAQLAEHEVLVHTLTMLNGRLQPHLGSLGLGSPRTTVTQEGLATTAELITRAMDLDRLRRIALRIRAVAMGLAGADFIQVFGYFLESGQSPHESFSSTMRVFRGGDPRGGVVFTKDAAYLHGMISVHTFLRKALQSERLELIHWLFAGRLSLGDVLALAPYFESGLIAPPKFEPKWLRDRGPLAGYLVYSIFVNRIQMDLFELDLFADR